MSDFSVPALQSFVGGKVSIHDTDRRFMIGGTVTAILPDGNKADILYTDSDGDWHYAADPLYFHNGLGDGVFTSATHHVTITFSPP